MRQIFEILLFMLLSMNAAHALSLSETYELAKENDPNLKAAESNHFAASEIHSQSIAQMLPNISVTGISSFNRSSSAGSVSQTLNKLGPLLSSSGGLPAVPILQHFWNNTLSIDLKQPVFHLEHWLELNQTDNKIAQSEARFLAYKQSLIRQTIETYINVLSARSYLNFNNTEKKATGELLEQTKLRVETGVIPSTDYYEAQAEYDRLAANEIDAQNQLERRKDELRKIIGPNNVEVSDLSEDFPITLPTPDDAASWIDAAEKNNFTIIAQLNLTEYLRKTVEIKEAKHLPTLDLYAQYVQTDTSNFYATRGDVESVGLILNIPLFEGGDTSSKVRQAEHEYEASKQEFIKAKRDVMFDVRDAYRGVVSSINRIKALGTNILSAQKALESVEVGFTVGTRTMTDVIHEQRALYRIKHEHMNSRYNYLIDGIKLKEASGSLTDEDLFKIDNFAVNSTQNSENKAH